MSPVILERLENQSTVEQQLEVFPPCGNYHTLCFVANSANLAPEPFASRFPAVA